MEEFLNKICEILGWFEEQQYALVRDSSDEIRNIYEKMDDKTQDASLDLLISNMELDKSENMIFLSFLFKSIRNEKMQYMIERVLLEENLPVLDDMVALYQLTSYLFNNPISQSREAWISHFRLQTAIHLKQVENVLGLLNLKLQYIPFEQRKKRVLLLCRVFMHEYHAPTAKIINISYWLQSLGYETYICCTYMGELEHERELQWFDINEENCVCQETGHYAVNYFGKKNRLYNINYTTENYKEETKKAVLWVRDYNPEFILDVGGENVFAGVCNQFTTVCTMGCVNKPVISAANIYVRYFECTENDEKYYEEGMRDNQVLFQMRHMDELYANAKKSISREEYGIKENEFVILIAGNRLDTEVSPEFQNILTQILQEQSNTCIAFIGKCEKLEKLLKDNPYAERYHFLGFVLNFKEIMSIGDLFLNPPRQGGGTGAYYAIENEVPVLTLPHCDVAQVGEQFVCETIDEMPQIVDRYIHDFAYVERMKKICRENSKTLVYDVDNIKNIRKFCQNIEAYIKEQEQKNI